jgi:putative transposase
MLCYISRMCAESAGIDFCHNRLPQWRLEGGIYFITWRLHDLNDKLSPAERTIVADCIKFHKDQRYRLAIFVVMDDHTHILLQTLRDHDLSKTLRVLKGFTANEINKARGAHGTRWQKASHTELLESAAAIAGCREYIYLNPLRRWNLPPHEYKWLEWFE